MRVQASLEAAVRTLALFPSFGTREVVAIHGALTTCDAAPISATIDDLRRARVTVSFIGLPGEWYVAGRIARETGGKHTVPETYDALRAAVLAHCRPPPLHKSRSAAAAAAAAGAPRMVQMGFPSLASSNEPHLCACHGQLKTGGYACPRCTAWVCEVPSACPVCGLRLISAPNLARSYHHLFPVPPYVEVPSATAAGVLDYRRVGGRATVGAPPLRPGAAAAAAAPLGSGAAASDVRDTEEVFDSSTSCLACCIPLQPAQPRYVCPKCRSAFCIDCDQFIHESLHNCPGCS
jgi:transcription initiation factor TFIIH subunit 2